MYSQFLSTGRMNKMYIIHKCLHGMLDGLRLGQTIEIEYREYLRRGCDVRCCNLDDLARRKKDLHRLYTSFWMEIFFHFFFCLLFAFYFLRIISASILFEMKINVRVRRKRTFIL